MPRTDTHTAASAAPDVWARHYSSAAGFRYWPCEELVRSVGARRFGTVVEVGCGNGANLWFLAGHAKRVVGVDVSREALAAAADYVCGERCATNVALLEGEAGDLHWFADASVDAVVDVMVSQHALVREHDALYREYRRVLRPGGWLFLYHLAEGTSVEGDGLLLDAHTRSRLALFPDAGRVCTPPVWVLTDKLKAAGFRVAGRRGLTRLYEDGKTAHYAVIEGEAG